MVTPVAPVGMGALGVEPLGPEWWECGWGVMPTGGAMVSIRHHTYGM
jgi:hypothetical protein